MLVLPLWELPRIFTVRTIVTAVDAIRPKDFYFHGEIHDFGKLYISQKVPPGSRQTNELLF